MFLSRYTYRCTLSTEVKWSHSSLFPAFRRRVQCFFAWEISLHSTYWPSYCRTQRIQRKDLGNLDRLLNALLTFSWKRPTVNISCKKATRAEEAKFLEKTIIVPASINTGKRVYSSERTIYLNNKYKMTVYSCKLTVMLR